MSAEEDQDQLAPLLDDVLTGITAPADRTRIRTAIMNRFGCFAIGCKPIVRIHD